MKYSKWAYLKVTVIKKKGICLGVYKSLNINIYVI